MQIIHEKLDTITDIIEPILLVNISARQVYSHTPVKQFSEISDMVAGQWDLNLQNPLHRVICNRIIINSILNN